MTGWILAGAAVWAVLAFAAGIAIGRAIVLRDEKETAPDTYEYGWEPFG